MIFKKNIKNLLYMLPLDFDPKKYRLLNSDIDHLLKDDISCIQHYLEYGIKQSRLYKRPVNSIHTKEFWNNGKNLLYFSPIAPDYDMSSGGNRLLQILQILKNYLKYNIWFLCNGFKNIKHIKKLQQLNIPIYLPDIQKNKYLDSYIEYAKKNNILFDNAIFSWYDIADQYVDIVKFYYPNIKIIIDTVDIHWVREHRGKNAGLLNITDEELYSNKNKEINTYKKANVILTVTNDDKVFLQKEIGYNNIKILSNIHDPKNIKKIEYNILFIGNYDHLPNIDAAQRAVKIYKKFQETKEYKNIIYQKPKLFIVGPNSKNINFSSDIYNDKQIIITDHTPDLDSIYSKCSVLLAPLNWGAGIKGKICDAAMANLAIITSPIGNEGINLTDSVNGFICTSNDSFVKSLCAFYKNTINEQQKIANLGQKHIHNIVSTQRSIDILKNTLEDKHVVISIIAFNNKERLYKCLSSIIKKTSYKNYHIVVTDNSTTQEIENSIGDFLKQNNIEENKITYIKNKINEFFIIANNKVMLDIKYKNSDIVLINDDIEIVSEDWLSYMVSSAYSSGDIGFVGGKTIFPDGKLAEAGAELYEDGFGRNIGRYDDPNSLIYNIPKYVGYCSGCFLLIKRETINKIGVFNTTFYPMYYEDSELQYRGHSFGLNTLYEPRAIAIHDEGSSAGTNIENGTKRFQEINRLKFIDIIKNFKINE